MNPLQKMVKLSKLFSIAALFVAFLSVGGTVALPALLTPVKDLLQFNVFGIPVLHKTTNWPFDPEVGARRSRQYQEVNGRFGEKAIERLGLGIDGNDLQRLAEQQARDAGHLGGLNYYLP